jgi:hypothetical protein
MSGAMRRAGSHANRVRVKSVFHGKHPFHVEGLNSFVKRINLPMVERSSRRRP